MRLVYITSSTFPQPKASSVQVMQMCAAFAAAGADVALVVRTGEPAMNREALQRHYAVPSTFEIWQPPWPQGLRPFDRFQLRAVGQASEWANDQAWICYARGRDLTAPVAALLRGKALAAVEVHGQPASRREKWLLRWISQHKRGWLIAISPALQDLYIGLGCRPERVVVAPDGVDMARFSPPLSQAAARAKLGLTVKQPLVVYVGGLYAGRGLETLVEALRGLSAQLLIVGGRSSSEVTEWQQRLAGLGLPAEQVQFAGYQAPERVPLYLFAGDVLAMPYSRATLTPSGEDTTAWMSPLKLFEYLAAGRPVVASDLPALRRVLKPGENALLAEPDDPAALRAALQQALTDGALAEHLGQQARQTASQHSWQARAEFILGVIGAGQPAGEH